MNIRIVEHKILEQALDKSIQNDFIALKQKQVHVFLYGTVIVFMVTTRKW